MKKNNYYIIIIIFAFLSVISLLMHPKQNGADTTFHIANISDLVSTISLENPFPKISSNIGNGMGYSTRLFYGPLSHYFTAYFHLFMMNFGFEVWDTFVLVYLLVAVASGIMIFELTDSIIKNKNVALVSAIMFTLMPYRVGEFCSISSMSQAFVSIFFPMILLSLNRMIDGKKFLLLFVIGFTGMILSHLVLSMYACIFLIFWLLFHLKQILNKELIKKMFLGVLIVSIMVLPFISLTLSQKFGADISMYQDGYMWWLESDYIRPISLLIPTDPSFGIDVSKFGLNVDEYFWSVPQYINIIVIISFFISLVTIIIKRKINKKIFYHLFLIAVCLFLFSKYFPWKLMPSAFYKVQFQRRFFVFLDISLSILAPLWLIYLKPKKQQIVSTIIIVLLIITSIPLFDSLTRHGYFFETVDYSNGTGWHNDYYPVKSAENKDYIESRGLEVKCNNEFLDSAVIYSYGDQLIFKIDSIYEENIVELPRFFYAGYKLTNSYNESIPIYENEVGLIEFRGSSDTYTLKFVGPLIYRIFVVIRYLFILGFISYLILKKKYKKNIKVIQK